MRKSIWTIKAKLSRWNYKYSMKNNKDREIK